MKTIITVIGKDHVGIIAKVSAILSQNNINILDISQTIMQDIFTMIMLADMKDSKISVSDADNLLSEVAEELGVAITIQREDIFSSMHKI